jgi:hypothetical protein
VSRSVSPRARRNRIGDRRRRVSHRPPQQAALENGVRLPRVDRDRRLDVTHGAVEIAEIALERAAREIGRQALVVETHKRVLVGERAREIAEPAEDLDPPHVAVGLGGLEAHIGIEIAERLFGLAQIAVDQAAVVERVGVVRLDADRGRVVGDRTVDLVLPAMQQGAAEIGRVVLGIERDRAIERSFRLLVLALVVEADGAFGEARRAGGAGQEFLQQIVEADRAQRRDQPEHPVELLVAAGVVFLLAGVCHGCAPTRLSSKRAKAASRADAGQLSAADWKRRRASSPAPFSS